MPALCTPNRRKEEEFLNAINTYSDYFTGWGKTPYFRDVVPHEYTHSWNGKFRRPDDLWTPNYNVPMRDTLLWVYEGQTEYWGQVLAARSGLSR
jgi:predicted metalloprotease with PDZ domain